ncbi:uncharacterized protein LOC132614435 [Lycium barbarum]|uniref:uncharacterized protein LOC132614435 n=1 Tax=Lycium barbarum TaxID=112863 RepID=UPI00293F070C|nr:uncharacterized protein LOC132614435 [Lycium barbarum]
MGTTESSGSQISKLWSLWGDFNVMLNTKDWKNGSSVTRGEVKDFAECVQDLMLNELNWRGDYYTWSNKQQGGDRVYSRFDRALRNDDWMMQFGHLVLDYQLPFISDHSPMLLSMRSNTLRVITPFRFSNIWAQHDQFLPLVEASWTDQTSKNKMNNVWLKNLRHVLKQLNTTEFGVSERIALIRSELQDVQSALVDHYSDALADAEKQLVQQLEKWSLIEERIFQQKSRAMWIGLGDFNTKYF